MITMLKSVGLSLIIAISVFQSTKAQSTSCSTITIDDLGNAENFSVGGLVSASLRPGGEQSDQIETRIVDFNVVCDASGSRRNTSSYVSVLVEFQCDSVTLAACDGESANITRQFQFSCIEQSGQPTWSATIENSRTFVQTLNPTATLTTPLDNRCRRCIDDTTPANSNPTTHCEPCPETTGCDQGQMRCYFGTTSEECCNFYDNNTCVAECPSPFVGDSETYDCGCGELSLENGYVTYTNRSLVGSVATYVCSSDYQLLPQDEETRTCTVNGWSGQNVTCQCVQCPDLSDIKNGKVIVTSRCINSTAEYTCDNDYKVAKGDVKRTCQSGGTWSGNEPECNRGGLSAGAIAGIVIATIVGLAVVVVMTVVIIVIILKLKNRGDH